MDGTGGLKKDIKKALKLYKRAADLGNTIAQDALAVYYFLRSGDSDSQSDLIRCYEKSRYYAEKAAHQGAINSQYILARLIITFDWSRKEESSKLMTLAAFQGHPEARYALGNVNEKFFQYASSVRGEAWKRSLLLSLYWYGKGAELEAKDPRKGHQSLTSMTRYLDLAMTLLWHPRDDDNRDPLPGYSHVPFCTGALAKVPMFSSESPFDCWKYRCANCGNKSGEKQEFKACARCGAFHYCSKKCQVEHWKAGHKVDCKGHWIEEFFPDIRKASGTLESWP
jgi:hypothetical protein